MANLSRSIEPEWLDELPATDPRAVRSRRDLARINGLMMNGTFIVRELRRAFPVSAPRAIVEIGAGDGRFMLAVAGKLGWGGVDIVLLDQQNLLSPQIRGDFSSIGWQAQATTANVFDWLAQPEMPVLDVIIANLFLHHFDTADLARLLALVARRTRILIACEPRRSARALFASRLLGVVGCNDVTRHDAVVSVSAGFRDQELSGLWPAGGRWRFQERAHGLFSHGFVAARNSGIGDGNAGKGEM